MTYREVTKTTIVPINKAFATLLRFWFYVISSDGRLVTVSVIKLNARRNIYLSIAVLLLWYMLYVAYKGRSRIQVKAHGELTLTLTLVNISRISKITQLVLKYVGFVAHFNY